MDAYIAYQCCVGSRVFKVLEYANKDMKMVNGNIPSFHTFSLYKKSRCAAFRSSNETSDDKFR